MLLARRRVGDIALLLNPDYTSNHLHRAYRTSQASRTQHEYSIRVNAMQSSTSDSDESIVDSELAIEGDLACPHNSTNSGLHLEYCNLFTSFFQLLEEIDAR